MAILALLAQLLGKDLRTLPDSSHMPDVTANRFFDGFGQGHHHGVAGRVVRFR
ncbi:MAG TPA: hypothetical protein VHC22_30735 [Pirellulales bacterium]|nr:hypothetical protein [Pirellulales bacterium]